MASAAMKKEQLDLLAWYANQERIAEKALYQAKKSRDRQFDEAKAAGASSAELEKALYQEPCDCGATVPVDRPGHHGSCSSLKEY